MEGEREAEALHPEGERRSYSCAQNTLLVCFWAVKHVRRDRSVIYLFIVINQGNTHQLIAGRLCLVPHAVITEPGTTLMWSWSRGPVGRGQGHKHGNRSAGTGVWSGAGSLWFLFWILMVSPSRVHTVFFFHMNTGGDTLACLVVMWFTHYVGPEWSRLLSVFAQIWKISSYWARIWFSFLVLVSNSPSSFCQSFSLDWLLFHSSPYIWSISHEL